MDKESLKTTRFTCQLSFHWQTGYFIDESFWRFAYKENARWANHRAEYRVPRSHLELVQVLHTPPSVFTEGLGVCFRTIWFSKKAIWCTSTWPKTRFYVWSQTHHSFPSIRQKNQTHQLTLSPPPTLVSGSVTLPFRHWQKYINKRKTKFQLSKNNTK